MSWGRSLRPEVGARRASRHWLAISLMLSSLGCAHLAPPPPPSGCEAPPPPPPPQGVDVHRRLYDRTRQARPPSESRRLQLAQAEVLGDPFPSTPRYHVTTDLTQRRYRLRISDRCIAAGYVYASVLRICVSAEGSVSSVEVLRHSIPAVDDQFPRVIGRWRYDPYLEDGVPTPFCYVRDYRIDVKERTGWLF
jgi:hypothetical protein